MAKVVPFMTPHMATRGAGISVENPHEGATYPYPLLIALADQKERLVHDVAKVIHLHYDEFQGADPGGVGWALDRQLFSWSVPFHAGAVAYFKSIGVWNDEHERNNQALIARQDLLAQAWQSYLAAPSSSDFKVGWYQARAKALQAQELDPIWVQPEG